MGEEAVDVRSVWAGARPGHASIQVRRLSREKLELGASCLQAGLPPNACWWNLKGTARSFLAGAGPVWQQWEWELEGSPGPTPALRWGSGVLTLSPVPTFA